MEWTKALKATNVGSKMPLTSCKCSIAAMVALIAVEAAVASNARSPSSSLPLPLHADAYERRAA
eukprot:5573282-Pleurochrysis_carterae.AAC.14